MAKRVFRIGQFWVNLEYVYQIEHVAKATWGWEADDNEHPGLLIYLLPGTVIQLTQREIHDAGWPNVTNLLNELANAMDGLNG